MIGPHPFMLSLSPVPLLKLLMVTTAMNSYVQHLIARVRVPDLGLSDDILIRKMQGPPVTWGSTQRFAGVKRLLIKQWSKRYWKYLGGSCGSKETHWWIDYGIVWKKREGKGNIFNSSAYPPRSMVSNFVSFYSTNLTIFPGLNVFDGLLKVCRVWALLMMQVFIG